MGRIWKSVFVLFLSALMLCSCGKHHTKPVYEVVTGVDVLTEKDGQLLRRHYEAPEKIRPVLLYLRTMKHAPLTEEISEPEGDDIFLIAVTLSSGRMRYYRQAKHRYFSFDGGAWRQIEPAHAAKLYRLLQEHPSDGL